MNDTRPTIERISYSLEDASRATGIGRKTLLQAIYDKDLHAFKIGVRKGKWIIRRKDLEAWLEAQAQA